MAVSVSLVLEVILGLVTLFISLVVAGTSWYFKTHLLPEIRKNSEFRRYAMGTSIDQDEGALPSVHEDIEGLKREMRAQHQSSSQKLDYAINCCERLMEEIDGEVDEPERKWESADD